ncbi:ABC family protein [Salmonella bongori]|nr:ABC family protein [Salmonella bongori]
MMEKRRPWGERTDTDTEKGAPVSPAFSSWSEFFAMGGYAFFVWLAVAMTVVPLAALRPAYLFSAPRHFTRRGAAARPGSPDACGAGATGGRVNIRRKNRLWIACGILAGLALTLALILYALRSNIDLFYTPGRNPLR